MAYIIYKCKTRFCRETLYTKDHALQHYMGSLSKREALGKGKIHFDYEMTFVFEEKDILKARPDFFDDKIEEKAKIKCPFCNGELKIINYAFTDEKDLIDLNQCELCDKFIQLTIMDEDDE
ncbi:hypothetical protein LCGC14_0855060 [marine sediment metagenome]|uniref:Uncharacterized protein n=1 Tax=marine sediment metagenome TaxID=412755 RepID=A0A0F9P985_9ZZZZ